MITIQSVRGDVALLDQTSSYLQPALAGMVLQPGHDYLIACGQGTEATLLNLGERTRVGPGEWYVVTRRGVVRKGQHHEMGHARLFFGRLWAMIARDNPDLGLSGNVAVGIRG